MTETKDLQTRRQLAMVMDLNKCIGCQTCTLACKTQWTNRNGREGMYWNNVETQPGQGYPRGYDKMGGGFDEQGRLRAGRQPTVEDYGVPFDYDLGQLVDGGDVPPWTRPSVRPTNGPNWDEDHGAGSYPNSYHFYLPRLCNHCTHPACLEACPRKAIYKRPEDGIVLIDQARCRGNGHCIEACPYKKIYFNELTSRSEKCVFCYPRIEKGLPPACARQCVGRIRFVGYRDDPEGPIHKLVDQFKVALPLHAEWGTMPNVFYVPPLSPAAFEADGTVSSKMRIPTEYLESLFGPRVEEVLALLQQERRKKAAGEKSELMDLLIGYEHAKFFRLARGTQPA